MRLKPIAIPLTGLQPNSKNLDKGLVWDAGAGMYRLFAGDLLEAQILKKKPMRPWILWPLVAIFTAAMGAAGGIAFQAYSQHQAGNEPRAVAEVLPAAPAAPAVPAPPPKASVAVVAATAPVVVAVAAATPAATSPVASAARPVSAAVATVRPAQTLVVASSRPVPVAATTKPKVQLPATPPMATTAALAPARPEPKLIGVPTVQARVAEPQKPETSVPGVLRGWPVSVEVNGVKFFDGTATKLYKLGDSLPNGEKIVDVDEGSATFATDKGVRQIRSSKLKGNLP